MNEHDDLHDEKISALYRQLPPVEPKQETDELILAAARRAVGAGPQRRLRPGWRSGLATAASVLLVGVLYVWQGPAYRHAESMAPAPVAPPAAIVAAPAPTPAAAAPDIGALQAAGAEPESPPGPAPTASGGSKTAHRPVTAVARAVSPTPVIVEEKAEQPAQLAENRLAAPKPAAPSQLFAYSDAPAEKLSLSAPSAPPTLADNSMPESQSRSMAPPVSNVDIDGLLDDKPAPAAAPSAGLALAAPQMQGAAERPVYQLYMEQGRYALAYQQIDITLALHDPWVRLDYDLLALLDNPAHRPLLCRQHPVKRADDAIVHDACLVLHGYAAGSGRHRAAQAKARRRLAKRIGEERPERDYWLRALDALEEKRAEARKAQ